MTFGRYPAGIFATDFGLFAKLLEIDVLFKWPNLTDYPSYSSKGKKATSSPRAGSETNGNGSIGCHFGESFKLPLKSCVFSKTEFEALVEYIDHPSYDRYDEGRFREMIEGDAFAKEIISSAIGTVASSFSEDRGSSGTLQKSSKNNNNTNNTNNTDNSSDDFELARAATSTGNDYNARSRATTFTESICELSKKMIRQRSFLDFEYEPDANTRPHVRSVLDLETLLFGMSTDDESDQNIVAAYAVANRYLEIYRAIPLERWLSGIFFACYRRATATPYEFWDERFLSILGAKYDNACVANAIDNDDNDKDDCNGTDEYPSRSRTNGNGGGGGGGKRKKRPSGATSRESRRRLARFGIGIDKRVEAAFCDPEDASVLHRNLLDCPRDHLNDRYKEKIASLLNLCAVSNAVRKEYTLYYATGASAEQRENDGEYDDAMDDERRSGRAIRNAPGDRFDLGRSLSPFEGWAGAHLGKGEMGSKTSSRLFDGGETWKTYADELGSNEYFVDAFGSVGRTRDAWLDHVFRMMTYRWHVARFEKTKTNTKTDNRGSQLLSRCDVRDNGLGFGFGLGSTHRSDCEEDVREPFVLCSVDANRYLDDLDAYVRSIFGGGAGGGGGGDGDGDGDDYDRCGRRKKPGRKGENSKTSNSETAPHGERRERLEKPRCPYAPKIDQIKNFLGIKEDEGLFIVETVVVARGDGRARSNESATETTRSQYGSEFTKVA